MKENEMNEQARDQDTVTGSGIRMDIKDAERADLVDKEQTSDVVSAPNFGQKLRDERVKRGMNIGEVAHRLRLSEQQIQAIEEQDFSKLPAAVFLRGYVRNYANLLQLDDTTMLVEAIARPRSEANIFTSKSTAQRFKAMEPVYQTNRSNRGGWLLLYVAVILAAFVAYGLYYDKVSEKPTSSYMLGEENQAVQPDVVSGSDQATIDFALPFSPTVSTPSSVESPVSGERRDLPPVAAVLPDVPVTPSSPAIDDVSKAPDSDKKLLHFIFSKDSWVKIKDGSGQIILEKINPRGSEQTIEGKPPLYLVIGNAAGVNLTYNGNKVDLGPYTRNNDDVARFSLE